MFRFIRRWWDLFKFFQIIHNIRIIHTLLKNWSHWNEWRASSKPPFSKCFFSYKLCTIQTIQISKCAASWGDFGSHSASSYYSYFSKYSHFNNHKIPFKWMGEDSSILIMCNTFQHFSTPSYSFIVSPRNFIQTSKCCKSFLLSTC